MNIHYVLTALSPSMFGARATVNIKLIPNEEAKRLVDGNTKLMATRVTHDNLGRTVFPNLNRETTRYVALDPGVNAIQIHYRGPPLSQEPGIPDGAVVSCYLIEVKEYSG